MPIYSLEGKGFSVKQAVSLIVKTTDHFGSKMPYSCKETAVFVIDTSKLKHVDDIRSHELGAMKNERVQKDTNDKTIIKTLRKNLSLPRHGIYMLKRSYFSLKNDSSFKR